MRNLKITTEILGVLLQLWAIIVVIEHPSIYTTINAFLIYLTIVLVRRVISQLSKNG